MAANIYVLYYDFKNTSGNHAGIAYLAHYLKSKECNVKLIRHIPQEYRGGKYVGYVYSLLLSFYLFIRLKENDKVFFMEYISGNFGFQNKIAGRLRFWGKKNILFGLVHLSGEHLMEIYKHKSVILSKLLPLSKVVVFGSSLKSFIEGIGYTNEVIRTFHYVDTNYYHPKQSRVKEENVLKVIFIGSLKRNFGQLLEIIKSSDSSIHFHICLGRTNHSISFKAFSNVTTYGFISEDELLDLMQSCDVNLSVMNDTIGSNAITCSMAVGLVQVVSEVGSIRDYCDESSAIFCNVTEDYVSALNLLSHNSVLLKSMKEYNLKKSNTISKEKFLTSFREFMM